MELFFYVDDSILLSGSRHKIQRMIDIYCDYSMVNGITFNPKKRKWFATYTAKDFSDCEFKLGGVIINRKNVSKSYLGVKFMMKPKMLVIDVDERIRKFSNSAYSVLLNTNDLSQHVRCEIIVKSVPLF